MLVAPKVRAYQGTYKNQAAEVQDNPIWDAILERRTRNFTWQKTFREINSDLHDIKSSDVSFEYAK